jgi:LysM repeat protein
MPTVAAVLKTARHYADAAYKEGKNNANIFGKHYGINNIPWCAEFVSYCYDINGLGKLVAAQSKKGFISCTAGVAWFKKNKRLVKVANAQPGDIVFMNFHGSKTAADHVEIVLRNDKKAKLLYCIGGNTVNPDGTGDQANGDGVYYKTRPYRYITYVAHPAWETVAGNEEATEAPVTPPAPPVAPPAPAKPAVAKPKPAVTTYKVKAGDSYWSIADKNGLDFKALQKLNGNKALKPGDTIKLK